MQKQEIVYKNIMSDTIKKSFLIIALTITTANMNVSARPSVVALGNDILNKSLTLPQKIAFKTSDKNHHINFDDLPFNQSIKTIQGNGSNKIAVFYEIDCGYCKHLEKNELSQIKNVTIYTFLFTNESHFSSWKKAESILCASDVNKAWNDFIVKDHLAKNIKSCDTPLDKNKVLALKLGVKGTPTLFFSNGSKAAGVLKAKEIEQRFLDASFYSD